METSQNTPQDAPETEAQETAQTPPVASQSAQTVRVESDLDFIRRLELRSRETYKKCFQCGTCSATCSISPDPHPFPRKEMIWAVWGMKDRLMADPDVWLCYHCGDCTVNCPRGARPGDVMAAIRRECIRHYSFPRFLGEWVCRPRYVPLLLALPVVFLGLAMLVKDPIEKALNITHGVGEKITYSYSAWFPHWLLNSFFILFSFLVVVAGVVGLRRFWRAMVVSAASDGKGTPVKGLGESIFTVLKIIFSHKNFAGCGSAKPRYISHFCVFFGFLALSAVTIWVITYGFGIFIDSDFIYPFHFLSPWKILANLGGASVLLGCILMILDRLEEDTPTGGSTYFDWAFILILMLVVMTGFASELLHYLRLEPHRHIIYFAHLALVFVLLMNLPFSKFAHVIYRTTAMVFAEYTGRTRESETGK